MKTSFGVTLFGSSLLATLLLAAPMSSQAQSPPPRFELENNQLKLPAAIVFETGSDKIKPESEAALSHVVAYLNDKTYISLMRIENHSDNSGAAQAGQQLSEKRALAVGRWLIAHGIECKRLLAVGFGSTKPVADNATPDGKAQNRRTVFANAALRGRLIGGMSADGGGVVAGDLCK